MARTHEVDTGLSDAELLAELVKSIQEAKVTDSVDVKAGEITAKMYAQEAGVSAEAGRQMLNKWVKAGRMVRLPEKKRCWITKKLAVTYRWESG